MKKLSVIALAIFFALGSTLALAQGAGGGAGGGAGAGKTGASKTKTSAGKTGAGGAGGGDPAMDQKNAGGVPKEGSSQYRAR